VLFAGPCRSCSEWRDVCGQADKHRAKIPLPYLYIPLGSSSVLSPIPLQEFDEQKYRDFVRTLSDEVLIKEGKKMRWLSGDWKIVTTTPSTFAEQLKICRAEWRRRYPK
jgi:hypothetical protein